VENAIDAGASNIEVEVEKGGRRLIRVADDGCGMIREDAIMSLERHATSKICSEDDLFRILTMGFRGEALPSIASVSRFTLYTRTENEAAGTKIVVEGGKQPDIQIAARASGTTIEVEDLFFNVPGRRKFLKAEGTEFSHIVEMITRLAMSHPHIRFRLSHNGRVQLQAQSTDSLKERVTALLGRQVGDAMYPLEASDQWLKLRGLFSEPSQTNNSTKGIYLFVNNRFIRDRGLAHACQEAYRGTIEKGRYPYIAIFLDIDPNEVDVNVHPQKIEVRFHRQHEIYSRLLLTLRNAIAQAPWLQRFAQVRAVSPKSKEQSGQSDLSTSNHNAIDRQSRDTANTSVHSHPAHVRTKNSPQLNGEQAQIPDESTDGSALRNTSGHTSVSISGEQATVPAPASVPPRTFDEFRERFMRISNQQASPSPVMRELEHLPPLPQSAQSGLPFLPGWDPQPHSEQSGQQSSSNGARSSMCIDSAGIEHNSRPATSASGGFFSSLRYIGQFAGMYLLLEAPGQLIAIDQHAAHERVNYEKLLISFKASHIVQQPYLLPPRIELSLVEAQQAEQHLDKLERLGIVLEPFGGQSYALKAVPVILKDAHPQTLVRDVLEELAAGKHTSSLDERRDSILMRMACHGSVRGVHILSVEQVRALLQQMDEHDFRSHCPHGRPVFIEIPLSELEKRFHRT
jgi:DNA mismatch repair protein MutL